VAIRCGGPGLAASVAALLALYGRLDAPRWPTSSEQLLRCKRDDAAKAVGAVYGRETASIDEAYDLAFDAWYRMALSQDLRRKRKQSIYAVAVMALLLELAFVLGALVGFSR
jgi:hypothetical protein